MEFRVNPIFSGMDLVTLQYFRKINLIKSITYEIYFILTSVDWRHTSRKLGHLARLGELGATRGPDTPCLFVSLSYRA